MHLILRSDGLISMIKGTPLYEDKLSMVFEIKDQGHRSSS